MKTKMFLNIDYIPRYFELVGNTPYAKFETLFQKGVEKYIIVLNHDSLALFKDLYKYTNKKYSFNCKYFKYSMDYKRTSCK